MRLMLRSPKIMSINFADAFAHSLLGVTDRIKNVLMSWSKHSQLKVLLPRLDARICRIGKLRRCHASPPSGYRAYSLP